MGRLPLPDSYDQYQGWAPSAPSSGAQVHSIDRISNSITRDEMWNRYISKRRPVVIQGHLPDADWKGHRWTDLEYLRSTAGNVPVKIEPIHPTAGHFGTSVQRKTVLFSEFIDILKDPTQAGKWYLTTQYDDDSQNSGPGTTSPTLTSDEDDPEMLTRDGSIIGALDGGKADFEPELDTVLPAPTDALANDFPSRPELLGNLVLQQCNLWLGSSKGGKSSGLHHDFHDNLYILLSGYKRFLLFPPSAHRFLHPRGQVERVYPNGLIVYTAPGEMPAFVPGAPSHLSIRPDGLVPSDAARWRRQARLRTKQEIDELAAAASGEGKKRHHQRKGKAKQTREQELAEQAFLQAEAELLLCRMDEEGIDPSANTTDEDDDSDDSEDEESSAQLRRMLAAGGFPHSRMGLTTDDEDEEDEEDEDDGEDSDDDSDEEKVEDYLRSVPEEAKPLAKLALAGDETAFDEFCSYMAQLEDDEPGTDSEEDAAIDATKQKSSSPARLERISAMKRKRPSSAQGTSVVDDNSDGHAGSPPFTRFSAEEDVSIGDEDESSEHTDFGAEDRRNKGKSHCKKVKIAIAASSDNSGDPLTPLHEASSDDEEDLDASDVENDDDSDESDDSGPPLFPEADSESEFGDIDAGEAELEKLLALSGEKSAENDVSGAEEQDEPQSFSMIHPQTLHAHFDVLDDPSQPSNGDDSASNPKARKKNSKKVRPSRAESHKGPRPLPGCPQPIEVFLKPGEMLYLPASWYHEVTSSSLPPYGSQSDEPGNGSASGSGSNSFHMALNYWLHPPDALSYEPCNSSSSSRARGASRQGDDGGARHGVSAVPGLGVEIGESARESLGGGTGTSERPYRDAEVWDEVARTVYNEVAKSRKQVGRWSLKRSNEQC
ncbi:hypothetical protein ACQY0O_000996 [Thecaphora frezii]